MKLLLLIRFVSFGILLNLISCPVIKAQVVPDNSLPNNSVVTPDGQVIQIEGGTRRGDNLFHSFEEFSVPADRTATFNNAADVQNIFSRVTGNLKSEIDGALSTQGAANLFLINPNGIIFGENAALDIDGSFLATTAKSLFFEDGTQFNPIKSQTTPLLTITAPVGLGLGTNPGQIVNRSGALSFTNESPSVGLQIQPRNTLALLGGEIILDEGFLTANGGRIELGAVADENIVSLISDDRGWILNYEEVNSFQDINLAQSRISSFSNVGGDITIQGKNITLTEASLVFSATSDSNPGTLIVKGSESVVLNGLGSGLVYQVNETVSDDTGILNIETKQLSILNGAAVNSTNNSADTAVSTQIIASESILIEGVGITESGRSGSRLSASSAFLNDPSSESNMVLPDSVMNRTGDLILETKELAIKNGGQISVSTFDRSNAGNLTVVASDSILLQGRDLEGNIASGIFAQVGEEATGNGGSLSIETSQLTVLDGAQISTAARNSGQGGNIKINVADSILLSGTSPVSNAENNRSNITASAQPEATGDSGNIELNTKLLIVEKGAALSVNNRGTGEAGNLNINAQNIILNEASFTAETRKGDEGNINIDNADTLLLRNSEITTDATELATGGDITLNADGIVLLDNSSITANAEEGQGGNIQITTQGILRELNSDIDAESEFGVDGTVTFNTPDVDPVSGVENLPDVPIDTEAILARDFCRLENEKIAKGSSFTITGRGGLIPTSKDSLSNRDRLVDWASRDDIEVSQSGAVGIRKRQEDSTAYNYPKIQQSQGLLVAADGSKWLTANVPNSTQTTTINHPDCQD